MSKKLQGLFKGISGNKELLIGLICLAILLFLAIFGSALAPFNPKALNDTFSPPNGTYFFGTDNLGQDIFSQVLVGARTSLTIGFIAAIISALIGTVLGGIAGYFGGWLDRIINEIMNIFLMLPTFFLILLIVALFGSSIWNVMIVIGMTSWVGNARLMRAQAISLKERTFIKSSMAIGESKFRILVKHVLPNGIFPIIANTTMNISSAILTEASLSFLGLGDPNVVSWGQIISNGKQFLPRVWWVCTFAGIATIFTVLTFFIIGDGLNKVLSPKMAANK